MCDCGGRGVIVALQTRDDGEAVIDGEKRMALVGGRRCVSIEVEFCF